MDTVQTLLDRLLKNSNAIVADMKALRAQLATPTPAPAPTPVPNVLYPKALTDRIVRPKPAPFALGPAGSSWTDPIYGTKLWRVTDPNTNNGQPFRAPSSIGGAWNADGSVFWCVDGGLGVVFFKVDAQGPTRLPATIRNQAEPWFSCVDPNLIYHNAAGQYRLIKASDLSAGTSRTVIDLDATYADKGLAPGGYIGPLVVVDNDVLVVLFGGGGQDSHMLVHHSALGLIDARTLTIKTASGQITGFTMHGIGVDRTGRLLLNPAGTYTSAPYSVAQSQSYDPATKTLTPITVQGFGHYTLGYGQMVNQDADVKRQWWCRSLNTIGTVTPLVNPAPTPTISSISEHCGWRNAKPGQQLPIISSLFRQFGAPPDPWGVWDDEIIGVSTDGGGTVYRFCHHQAVQTGDYWDQPLAHVDPTGRYAIFTSNWGRTVGAGRQDVFLAQLQA